MTKKIKGILFDKDGTLFDFRATWSPWAKAFFHRVCMGDEERAAEVSKAVGFNYITGEFALSSIVIAGTPDEIAAGLAPFFPEFDPSEILNIINDEAASAPMAEAVPLAPLLDELKIRGARLGVATNDAEAPARAHLEAARVADKFDFIAGSDSGFGGKPHPGQIYAFCEAVGLEPEQVAMVGDSLHDLHAGRAAGCFCIGVLTGLAGPEVLSPAADLLLSDIGEIPDWLDQSAS